MLSSILGAHCQGSCKQMKSVEFLAYSANICCVCHMPELCCVAVTTCVPCTPKPLSGILQGSLLGQGCP